MTLERSMVERLSDYLRAAYPCVAVETHEEQRALRDVIEAAATVKRTVATWSATEGVKIMGGREFDDTGDLLAALGVREPDTVFVLRDAQSWSDALKNDPRYSRALRDFLIWAPENGSTLVMVGAKALLHPTVEKYITVLDYSLPGAGDLARTAAELAASSVADGEAAPVADELVIRALGGLSTAEAANALSLSLVETRGSERGMRFEPSVIYREKTLAVKRSGVLQIIEPDPRGLAAVGGLDVFKDWLELRRESFGAAARAYGLSPAKGVVVVGVPGTGKSLVAKAIGTAFRVPTVRLDVGSMKNSLVGESERITRETFALVDALGDCVLWLDEVEKGFAGVTSGGGDAGVSVGQFGTFITWLQERRGSAFCVATANNVAALPPETFRKGRWDELFAVDLPNGAERLAIFEIHIAARGRNAGAYELGAAVAATDGFTGAEIEACVNEAMFAGFSDGRREFTAADLVAAARDTVPLSVTAKEQIEGIRKWAKGRARFASRPDATVSGLTSARRLG